MDNSTIGIKIADGSFFPVLEEDASGKKKLVLTTVNDDQGSVQIDLYKGKGEELRDALYVGSLVIEDIMPAMKGEPEIELIIGIDEEGNLKAEAGDAATAERQSLSVSLESLDEGDFSTPNFELDDSEFDDLSMDDISEVDEIISDELASDDEVELPVFDDDFSLDDEEVFHEEVALEDEAVFDEEVSLEEDSAFDDSLSFDDEPSSVEVSSFDDMPAFDEPDEPEDDRFDKRETSEERKRRSPLAVIVLIILILAILGLGALLIIRGMNSDSVPPLEADDTPAVTEPEVAAEPEPLPPEPEVVAEVVEPEPEVVAEPEPVMDEKVSYDSLPPEGHGGGVWYRLKWGDTLWDLSNSFYRTPWLYGLIAVENGIKNPDVIYAGTDILIPEN
ncbi:MAG: Hsp70 family protein [Spirochaetales bacterium]|uniref:Hsp70 family protein n=1 Tax=Candidatus Thalassospirochaeta sargassi TaxID=3119039 RepID=A0AAJ1ML16_9SPIO|nr:Hsp70 family protein [Spirochaetales bacterium]